MNEIENGNIPIQETSLKERLLHRHKWKPLGYQRQCDCGAVGMSLRNRLLTWAMS